MPEFLILFVSGDTVFDVFLNPPNPDLLKVKLLITEATFLDEEIGRPLGLESNINFDYLPRHESYQRYLIEISRRIYLVCIYMSVILHINLKHLPIGNQLCYFLKPNLVSNQIITF